MDRIEVNIDYCMAALQSAIFASGYPLDLVRFDMVNFFHDCKQFKCERTKRKRSVTPPDNS